MILTNSGSGTNICEIADGIYRINTPVEIGPDERFSFNQYLIAAERPLLFHTGPRRMFELVREAVEHVLSVSSLRYIGFCHFEADECGSLNEWLAVAPQAQVICSAIAAMTSIGDISDRPPRPMGDGELLGLEGRRVQWIDAPHVPHGWDNGFMFETTTRTLFCGDLFTQPGDGAEALTEGDIFTPSEAFRERMDYYSLGPATGAVIERLATLEPRVLACMHGSAWRGDGAKSLRALARSLSG